MAKFQEYSNEQLIDLLKEYYKNNNNKILASNLRNNPSMPSKEYLIKRFNVKTWNDVLDVCEFQINHKKCDNIEERIRVSIEELLDMAKELGRCPKVSEYEKYYKNGFSRRVLESKIGLKYNDICQKYLSDYKLNLAQIISKEELILKLKELRDDLGRTPNFNEFMKFSGHTLKVIDRAFGKTYNELLEDLGFEVFSKTTKSKTTEELLSDFYRLFITLGRVPYSREIDAHNSSVNYSTYISKFGSIDNVCKLLNIDYDIFYKNTSAGTICRDSNGGLCKSKTEKTITDFLIENNIKFEKETPYAEIISKNKRFFDWKISLNNKIYYVEYFGMYNRKPRGTIDKKYSIKTKKKIKDLYKHNKSNDCIFIFPHDIKHKTLQEIFGIDINKRVV